MLSMFKNVKGNSEPEHKEGVIIRDRLDFRIKNATYFKLL